MGDVEGKPPILNFHDFVTYGLLLPFLLSRSS